MSAERNRRVDVARRAIRAEKPRDARRETVWQYHDRLAAAAVDALFREPNVQEPETFAERLSRRSLEAMEAQIAADRSARGPSVR